MVAAPVTIYFVSIVYDDMWISQAHLVTHVVTDMEVDEFPDALGAVVAESPVAISVSENADVKYSEDILIVSMCQHVKNHPSGYTISHRVVDEHR